MQGSINQFCPKCKVPLNISEAIKKKKSEANNINNNNNSGGIGSNDST